MQHDDNCQEEKKISSLLALCRLSPNCNDLSLLCLPRVTFGCKLVRKDGTSSANQQVYPITLILWYKLRMPWDRNGSHSRKLPHKLYEWYICSTKQCEENWDNHYQLNYNFSWRDCCSMLGETQCFWFVYFSKHWLMTLQCNNSALSYCENYSFSMKCMIPNHFIFINFLFSDFRN